MPHVQWLYLAVHIRDAEENDKGEIEPFIMAGFPSLTFLQLNRCPDQQTSSLSLNLPALLSLHHSVLPSSSPSHGLDFQCPKLETLHIVMERGMVIAPSLFSNLRSLEVTFHVVSVGSSESFAVRFFFLKLAGDNLGIAPCSLLGTLANQNDVQGGHKLKKRFAFN